MAAEVSKLPATQQARRERLLAEQDAAGESGAVTTPKSTEPNIIQTTPSTGETPPVVTPPASSTPVATTVVTTPTAEPAQLTRDEINALRAKAEKSDTEAGRREVVEMELAEANAALTALREASKGTGVAEAPRAAPSGAEAFRVDPGDVALSEKEQEEYGEAEPTITKVARREMARLINEHVAPLLNEIQELREKVTNVSTETARTTHENFVGQVKQSIANFDQVTTHKHWNDFLESRVPGAGITQRQALANAHYGKSLEDMKVIFGTFTGKYISDADNSGYTSVAVGAAGGADSTPPASNEKPMLKISDRRKASEDFIKNRITADEMDIVRKKFSEADREGRVDYNN